jgi:hypothetical protein
MIADIIPCIQIIINNYITGNLRMLLRFYTAFVLKSSFVNLTTPKYNRPLTIKEPSD